MEEDVIYLEPTDTPEAEQQSDQSLTTGWLIGIIIAAFLIGFSVAWTVLAI